ncbi:MAG: hypothetical protein ACRBFS_17425 [Aureispira sp.]
MNKIEQINFFIKNKHWIDFEFRKYKNDIVLIGSKDFTYYHEIEIIFKNVKKYSLEENWSVDTSKDFIIKTNEAYFINNEDISFEKHFLQAQEVIFNTDTVFYYKRDNLKEGERLADFIIKESGVPPRE